MRSVKLSGSVSASDDRDKAVRIAKLYAGDREVESHLSMAASLRLKPIFSFSRLQAHLSS
jgi:osmotically-inducible protein OsmY